MQLNSSHFRLAHTRSTTRRSAGHLLLEQLEPRTLMAGDMVAEGSTDILPELLPDATPVETQAASLADLNGDGLVGPADYTMLRDAERAADRNALPLEVTNQEAPPVDYELWKSNYGRVVSPADIDPVSDPADDGIAPGTDVDVTPATLASDVAAAINDPPVAPTPVLPDDERFGDQWSLDQIDAPAAWPFHRGSTRTRVAVVDTGINYTHRDLYLNIAINQDEIPSAIRANLVDVDGDQQITFYDLNHADPTTGAYVNQGSGRVQDGNNNGYIDGGDLLFATTAGGWEDGQDGDGNGLLDDLVGWDFADNDNDPMDFDGHGTHVAGSIGATADNQSGVAGVNWVTQIVPVRIPLEDRYQPQPGLENVGELVEELFSRSLMHANAAGLEYAVDSGARISNHSWGWVEPPEIENQQALITAVSLIFGLVGAAAGDALNDAIDHYADPMRDAVDYADAHDHLVVAAAGNGGYVPGELIPEEFGDGDNNDHVPHFPSSFPNGNVIAVANSNRVDELDWTSNFGVHSVDLAAPGEGILSLNHRDGQLVRFRFPGMSDLEGAWYRLQIGPFLSNLRGDEMNEDRDGSPGEATDLFVRDYFVRTSLPDPDDVDLGDDLPEIELPEGPGGGMLARPAGIFHINTAAIDRDPLGTIDVDTIEDLQDGVLTAAASNWDGVVVTGVTPSDTHVEVLHSVLVRFNEVELATISPLNARILPLDNPAPPIFASGIELVEDAYVQKSGTSMASPHVAGVAALVWDANPGWSIQQVRQQLLGTVDEQDALNGQLVTGGRINALRAVAPGAWVIGTQVITATGVTGLHNLQGPVTVRGVRVHFNEAIDPASFSAADIISINTPTGPNSEVVAESIVPVAGSGNASFDVLFSPITVNSGVPLGVGDYRVLLGADIRDMDDVRLDLDRDGADGEPGDDRYAIDFRIDLPLPDDLDDIDVGLEDILIDRDEVVIDLPIEIDPLPIDLGGLLNPSRMFAVSAARRTGFSRGVSDDATAFDREAVDAEAVDRAVELWTAAADDRVRPTYRVPTRQLEVMARDEAYELQSWDPLVFSRRLV